TRLPHPPTGGDVFGWHPDLNIFNYGPAPQANTWATYRVPFAPLGLGVVQIQAAANAGVLTVTAILNGGPPLVDGGGSIYGPGVPPGTFLMGQNQNSAIGTFPINNSFFMPSSQITFQRS
ncbi:hypothetical protein ACI4A4_27485, partial [Klebsiella pneumoniae]|uniref:hypothetical protein n=1 Tax=Klebsiella pneumoniae TaxID=573 RepID=UPI003851C0F2